VRSIRTLGVVEAQTVVVAAALLGFRLVLGFDQLQALRVDRCDVAGDWHQKRDLEVEAVCPVALIGQDEGSEEVACDHAYGCRYDKPRDPSCLAVDRRVCIAPNRPKNADKHLEHAREEA